MRVIKYLMYGIAYGCSWFVLIGIIVVINGNGQVYSGTGFIEQAVAAIIVGIGFGTTPIIYESERLALPIKALVHMGIGFAVFFAVAAWVGWLPLQGGVSVVIFFIIAEIIIGFLIWGGFYAYHRHLATEINKRIRERQ